VKPTEKVLVLLIVLILVVVLDLLAFSPNGDRR